MAESEMVFFCIILYQVYKTLLIENHDRLFWSFRIHNWWRMSLLSRGLENCSCKKSTVETQNFLLFKCWPNLSFLFSVDWIQILFFSLALKVIFVSLWTQQIVEQLQSLCWKKSIYNSIFYDCWIYQIMSWRGNR